eukprot:TRINITY_DN5198_c0_g1_i1.p1 TRINITY_DN5198_c0_g1~~TRINITY_DN5198_c0_g1_i1.p1  ORF type:complete len:219 (-),score=35.40 TRINITY_DN5198_c0_g1_i1:87-743(-)
MIQWRQNHKYFATYLLFPIALTTLTGFGYRFSRDVLQKPKDHVEWLLLIHQGCFNLDYNSFCSIWTPIYTFLNFCCLFFMLITGFNMLRISSSFSSLSSTLFCVPKTVRKLHYQVAFLLSLPLFITSLSGFLFKWGVDVLQISPSSISCLMKMHQGSDIPKIIGGRVFYVSFLMVGVVCLIFTGTSMLPWCQKLFGWRKSNNGSGLGEVKELEVSGQF